MKKHKRKTVALLAAGLALAFFACKNNVEQSCTITVLESEHGSVTASASSATAGSTITLSVASESGYNLDKLTVTDASGNTVSATEVTAGEKYTFTMPASDVNVQATFSDIMYDITVLESEHGSVKASASSAVAGSEITLTVEDERGSGSQYVLDKLTVTDADGNSVPTTEVSPNYEYTFTMPKSYVTVSATFVELYNVTFESMGGSDVPRLRVKHGNLITKPDDPTKDGYVFLYWSSDDTYDEFDFNDNVITAAITLYAMWVPEGFARVQGTTFGGTTTLTPESQVFISGRSLTIGDLYVCDHEVTQKEYETYCFYGDQQSPSDTYGKGDNFPAYYVNWYDAIVYCNLRSMAEGFNPVYSISGDIEISTWIEVKKTEIDGMRKYCGPSSSNDTWNSIRFDTSANGYRLPTEAEWEYLARGGNKDTYTYSGSDNIDEVAWYTDNSDNKTHEVKQKKENSLGIYDMSGNVWEWCYDWNSSSIGTDTPATGAASGSKRVIRGGSYGGIANLASVSYRNNGNPVGRTLYRGFRVVRNAN